MYRAGAPIVESLGLGRESRQSGTPEQSVDPHFDWYRIHMSCAHDPRVPQGTDDCNRILTKIHFRYLTTKKATTLKNRILTTPKALNAASREWSACGVISTMQTHTPTAHDKLKSSELLRLHNLIISGILNKGSITADRTPIFSIQKSIQMGLKEVIARSVATKQSDRLDCFAALAMT